MKMLAPRVPFPRRDEERRQAARRRHVYFRSPGRCLEERLDGLKSNKMQEGRLSCLGYL